MADAFDAMFPRRPPMPADAAREVVAEMQRKTSKRAAVRMLTLALGPAGNLSDEARTIYRDELERLGA
jgi:HD-GYP domain-containing protein (c-di-GMP phosphodiesterase class II)